MPVQIEILRRLLLYLDEQIRLMQKKGLTKEELKQNLDLRQAMERRLQTAIEASIDLAFHIIAGEELGVVEHNKDALLLLGEKKIIPLDLARRLADATDMRNVLVHGYEKVDLDQLYRAITEDVKDLKEFAEEIDAFVVSKRKRT